MASITRTEVLAAFRCSKLTAEREGFTRKAREVQGYIDWLESIEAPMYHIYGSTARL